MAAMAQVYAYIRRRSDPWKCLASVVKSTENLFVFVRFLQLESVMARMVYRRYVN